MGRWGGGAAEKLFNNEYATVNGQAAVCEV